MTRLIDADSIPKVLDALCEKCGGYKRNKGECEYCKMDLFGDEVMALPTIDAVPVVHGHIEEYQDYIYVNGKPEPLLNKSKKCSVCSNGIYEAGGKIFKYCPHCGAKMDEVTP